MATILFDGVAYGMLLFVLACGLAVTLGLMNFVNLAHGAFAMAGGYVTVILMDRWGVPFLACLPAAFVVAGGAGLRCWSARSTVHMYGRSHLDQVLFSIGLVFMAVAAVDWRDGLEPAEHQAAGLAAAAAPRSWACSVGHLPLLHHRDLRRAGARSAAGADAHPLRQPAARRRRRCARGARARHPGRHGVRRHLRRSARASPGWAARSAPRSWASIPTSRCKFMIYFLIVVTVGGTSGIIGPFVASLLLGVADVAGKYYVPGARRLHGLSRHDRRAGAAPARPVRARDDADARRRQGLARRARWRWPEIVFWLVAFGALLLPAGQAS